MARREFEELFSGTARFSTGTRTCLERSVGRALYGRKCASLALRSAVGRATRELLAQGLDETTILTVLATMVEDAGRACGADRSSLLSGEPVWMTIQSRVLESAQIELAQLELTAAAS